MCKPRECAVPGPLGLLRQTQNNRVSLLSLLITSISEMFITITGVTIASIISEISFATRHFGLCSGGSDILCLSVTLHVAGGDCSGWAQ